MTWNPHIIAKCIIGSLPKAKQKLGTWVLALLFIEFELVNMMGRLNLNLIIIALCTKNNSDRKRSVKL